MADDMDCQRWYFSAKILSESSAGSTCWHSDRPAHWPHRIQTTLISRDETWPAGKRPPYSPCFVHIFHIFPTEEDENIFPSPAVGGRTACRLLREEGAAANLRFRPQRITFGHNWSDLGIKFSKLIWIKSKLKNVTWRGWFSVWNFQVVAVNLLRMLLWGKVLCFK